MSEEITITLVIRLPDGVKLTAGRESEPVVSVPVSATVRNEGALIASSVGPAPLTSLEADDSDWACPRHGGYRVVPAGTSKTTGKPYSAFRVCREQGCNEKEPRRRVA